MLAVIPVQIADPVKSSQANDILWEVLMEKDEGLSKRILFSDAWTFHLSGKVNRHNIQIFGTKTPVRVVEMKWDGSKVNAFCAISRRHVFGLFLYCREECYGTGVPDNVTKLVNATTHNREGVHFPTRWCPTTLAYGCPVVPQRTPTRLMVSSCITSSYLLQMATLVTRHDSVQFLPLWFHQGQCLLPPPHLKILPELWRHINNVIKNVTEDMLKMVWGQWEYRFDICHVTCGAYIECI
jgi:hypothetical protein